MKQVWSLCDCWKLHNFPFAEFSVENLPVNGWLDVAVPGDVHTALMTHGIITNPAFGTGDIDAAWVEKQIWVYRRHLSITSEMTDATSLRLRFEGLDTLSDVYLDGHKLCTCQNMFVEHVLNLTKQVGEGEHELILVFWPICENSRKEELPEGFWINYSLERAFMRKAGYMFGWDWTPRIMTCGIWRPVSLECVYGSELGSLHAQTLSIQPDLAEIAVSCPKTGEGTVVISVWEDEKQKIKKLICGTVENISIDNPRLWWTHDQGEPYLYTIRAELFNIYGKLEETKSIRLGIRTVEMQTCSDDGEARYVTLLNNRAVFLKGANWVPMSNYPSTNTHEKYDYYITLAKDACMNAFSLWGGGIYEMEDFYQLCDEKGILCWQYFMFACGEYPDWDSSFLSNVRDEIEKIADRLRSHCCIALWIGNVESEMLSDKIHLRRPMYGKKLFEEIMLDWADELMPGQIYIPSSPWGGETPNSMVSGDRHNWDVWFTDISYSQYTNDNTTFCSEFGLHAAPIQETIKVFTGEDNLSKESFLFKYLNRDQDLRRMDFYFRDNTGQPSNLEEYVNFSMLIQAEGLACGVEHYRRRFPKCGGSLIWQFNDCCICHSWSMIDALGVPKASYYESKRFFAPVLISLKADGNITEVWVTNNSTGFWNDSVYLEVGDFLGHRVLESKFDVSIAAGASSCIYRFAVGGRFSPNVIIGNRQRLFYVVAWQSSQQRFAKRFFEPQKELLLPLTSLDAKWKDDALVIRSNYYARQVKIDDELSGLLLSDNWFDMLPGQTRTLSIKHLWGKKISQRNLTLSAINAIPQKIERCPYEQK